jgi:hypothetical protein
VNFKHLMAFAVLLLGSRAGLAMADGTFIPASHRTDMVYDAQRDLIYIANGSSVLRYDITQAGFLSPIDLGGQLLGMDLSPDGTTLAVADLDTDGTNEWVHLVNLSTLVDTKVNEPLDSGTIGGLAGTWAVAYAADGSLLVTSQYAGSGYVPLLRLINGQWSTLSDDVQQGTMVSTSGDGQVVGFAGSNSSDGPWGAYYLQSGNVVQRTGYTNGTSWFNYEIGTNFNGSQFAIPTYGGTYIYDGSYNLLTVLGTYAGEQPIGVAYHPVENLVFFPWEGTSEVRVYDTRNFNELGSYDFEDTFQPNGNGSFVQGRTRLSADGSLLMVSVTGGVRFLRMYSPLAARNIAANAARFRGAITLITLKGSIGNRGALHYALVSGPAHGSVRIAGDRATYIASGNFTGIDSFTYSVSYGRATTTATVSVNPPVKRVPMPMSGSR